MAYDKKYRESVLDFLAKGNTTVKAHEVFGVSRSTIRDWQRIQKETGKPDKRPLTRIAPKLNPDRLQSYIAEHPDSYQRECAEEFNCTQSAVYYALKRLKLTRKKNC